MALSDWKKVYSTNNFIQAEIVKGALEAREIPAVIINKQDSQYNDFGEQEVYVFQENVLLSLKIIKDELQFE